MDFVFKNLKYRLVLAFCLCVTCGSIIYLSYLCAGTPCSLWSNNQYHTWKNINLKHVIADNMGRPLSFLSHPSGNKFNSNKMSYNELVNDNFEFDIKGSDVIVFLHIQKTGGTAFGKHLVKDLDLEQPCMCKRGRKKCKCFRPDSEDRLWLFSRYSTGWKCGLHADWTELTNCVDTAMDQTEKESSKRRYFYITLLREPITRFLSEFRHVQRGATWKTARHLCAGRPPTAGELPPCFTGEDWRGVTLEQFAACPSNLAFNRQTRMLADLTLVGCYNSTALPRAERDALLLASAKRNLEHMAFFGLCELQRVSQAVFEHTFHLRFLRDFEQLNITRSSATLEELSPATLQRLRELNHLDLELYDFARRLLLQRYAALA